MSAVKTTLNPALAVLATTNAHKEKGKQRNACIIICSVCKGEVSMTLSVSTDLASYNQLTCTATVNIKVCFLSEKLMFKISSIPPTLFSSQSPHIRKSLSFKSAAANDASSAAFSAHTQPNLKYLVDRGRT